jgi:hypothetical protein
MIIAGGQTRDILPQVRDLYTLTVGGGNIILDVDQPVDRCGTMYCTVLDEIGQNTCRTLALEKRAIAIVTQRSNVTKFIKRQKADKLLMRSCYTD